MLFETYLNAALWWAVSSFRGTGLLIDCPAIPHSQLIDHKVVQLGWDIFMRTGTARLFSIVVLATPA